MFEKPINKTAKTVKDVLQKRQQTKPVPTKPVANVTSPIKTTPRNVNFDNLKKEPRQLSRSPRITKPQTTGPSNQFEDAAVMSVGGGEVPSLTDPNVGAAVARRKQQVKRYLDMFRGILRRKNPT